MTKEEFEKLEEICKKSWRSLAKSGRLNKPRTLNKFLHNCPACELSRRATKDKMDKDCTLCPVDIWRNNVISSNAVCASSTELFHKWNSSVSDIVNSPYKEEKQKCTKQLKGYAKQISELKWSFLPKYKKVDIKDLL